MANGDSSAGGRLSLGERVHILERKAAEHGRALKKARAGSLGVDDEELISWVGKEIELVPADSQRPTERGLLKKVRRYTLLVDIGGILSVINKGQLLETRLVE